jgi:hypothetical protein
MGIINDTASVALTVSYFTDRPGSGVTVTVWICIPDVLGPNLGRAFSYCSDLWRGIR